MRTVTFLGRGVLVLVVSAILALGAFAVPRDRGEREKATPIVKLVKRVIKALGDGLVVPTP